LECVNVTEQVDGLLERLRSRPADHALDRLEAGVWSRIEASREISFGRTLQMQLAVTCGALLLGLAIAKFAAVSAMPMPLMSEIVVLSDDSVLAPSVRLAGGT